MLQDNPVSGKRFSSCICLFYVSARESQLRFHGLNDPTPFKEGPFVWALCDSNKDVESPAGLFKGLQGVRIIQTPLPRASHWKEWSKELGAKPYIMDIWSEEEVVHLAELVGLDVYRMKTRAEKWGNVAHPLVQFIDEDDWEVEALYRQDASNAVHAARIMLDRGPRLDLPNDPPSRFYLLRSMRTRTGAISWAFLRCHAYTTHSLHLSKGAQEGGQLREVAILQRFELPSKYPFGSRFHLRILVPQLFYCEPYERLPMGHAGLGQCHSTVSYCVQDRSALVLEDEIFVFQMTVSSTHRSPIEGLRHLRKMLPPERRDLPWRVVFVGPDEGPIKAVAKCWSSRLLFPQNEHPDVGWSVVDPAQADITYKEYHNESDLELTESEPEEELMEASL
ncbi:hypothetical protein HD554DRAFT_1832398 [Boletus coccyginus]|nr:hypothetical protein HD554DRAFT_1832398 [Boletus coccyginus]